MCLLVRGVGGLPVSTECLCGWVDVFERMFMHISIYIYLYLYVFVYVP